MHTTKQLVVIKLRSNFRYMSCQMYTFILFVPLAGCGIMTTIMVTFIDRVSG